MPTKARRDRALSEPHDVIAVQEPQPQTIEVLICLLIPKLQGQNEEV